MCSCEFFFIYGTSLVVVSIVNILVSMYFFRKSKYLQRIVEKDIVSSETFEICVGKEHCLYYNGKSIFKQNFFYSFNNNYENSVKKSYKFTH